MNLSQFKHDITMENIWIVEWMNEISIAGETYSETVIQKLNLYPTS